MMKSQHLIDSNKWILVAYRENHLVYVDRAFQNSDQQIFMLNTVEDLIQKAAEIECADKFSGGTHEFLIINGIIKGTLNSWGYGYTNLDLENRIRKAAKPLIAEQLNADEKAKRRKESDARHSKAMADKATYERLKKIYEPEENEY